MDLDELKAFMNERIRVAFPGTDVDPGSPFDTQVVQPLLTRLGPDPYETSLRDLALARLRTEFPSLVIQDGEPIDDLVIKTSQVLHEPFRRQIAKVSRQLSLAQPETLNEREADNLGGNFFVRRRLGGFSVGAGRLFFTAPQFAFVTPVNALFTGGGLRFFPVENQSITSERMLFNTSGSLYYFDVAVRAEKQGKAYNIPKGALVGVERLPQVVKVANLVPFEEGSDRETTTEFIRRVERSLAEKSLVTARGIDARLGELFDSIRMIQVIGHGDPEMKRDVIKGGLDAAYAYAEVTTSAGLLTLPSAGKIIDSTGATTLTFATAGVKVGDLATHLDLTTGKLTDLTVTAVTAMTTQVSPNPPTPYGANQKVWLKSRTRGTISLSDIPGGILEPQTTYGEIKIDNNQVHVGGVFDVFVRGGAPQQKTTSLVGIVDDKPLRFGLDLESQGADADQLVLLSELKTAAVATKKAYKPGADTEAEIYVKVDETGGAQSWYPTAADEGRYIQLIRSGVTSPADSIKFVAGTSPTKDRIDRTTGSWITDGFVVGMTVIVKRALLADNDGVYVASAVTATTLTLDTSGAVTTEASSDSGTISKRVVTGLYGIFKIKKVVDTSYIASTKSIRLKIELRDQDSNVDLPIEDTVSAFTLFDFRIVEKVGRRSWVRDRDGTGSSPAFAGTDFVGTVKAEVGDSVVIESGADAGIYSIRRILSHLGTNDLLVLDRALSSSLAVVGTGGQKQGLRYRVADDLDANIVDPRVVKIPLGSIFTGGDLRTVSGSRDVSVNGGDSNFLLAGVEVGDTLEILGGDDKGKYLISSFSGSAAKLDQEMRTSASSLKFSIYRAMTGVSRPLVRVKKAELNDAAGQPTGTIIPYGAIIDGRVVGGLANREQGKLVDSFTGKAITISKFQDTATNFVAKGVVKGDRLSVLEGIDLGEYTVDSITTTTNANDTLNIVAASAGGKDLQDLTTVNIQYRVGQPSIGKARFYFLDPTSVELDTGLTGGRLEFKPGPGTDVKEFRFSEVEGSLLLPPGGSTKGNPRGARVISTTDLGGGSFNSYVELLSSDHQDLYDAEIVTGDTLEVFEQVAFLDWNGAAFDAATHPTGPTGAWRPVRSPAGLRTVLGSNLVTVPSCSLIDFDKMHSITDLKGQQLIINSGPDAGSFTIEEKVSAKSLRLNRVMTTTTVSIQGSDAPAPLSGALPASFRDGLLLNGTGADAGKWFLKDATDSGNFGAVGDYIRVFEAADPLWEGKFKILAVDGANQRVQLENASPPADTTGADKFTWISIKAADVNKTIEQPFAIYKVTPTEVAILEVAPRRTTGPTGILQGDVQTVTYSATNSTYTGQKLRITLTTGSLTGVARGDRLEVLRGPNRGVYPVDFVDTGNAQVEVFPNRAFSVTETGTVFRIWGGLHGGRRVVKVGTFEGSSGRVLKGDALPYRVRRPKVHRTSSTEMAKNKEAGLYYVELTVESQGPGDDRNLAKNSRLAVTKGARVDGFTYKVVNNTLSFSPKEEVSLVFSRRFLPVGNSDSPQNRIELTGRNLGLTYESSTITKLVDDLLQSNDERPNNANPLARHFLPSYILLDLSYTGGSSTTVVGQDVEDFINGLGSLDKLEVSDVEALISRRGATFIQHPLTVVSVTHDLDRALIVERSDNKLGDTLVPYNGTARVSAFIAKQGDGLALTRTP